MTAHFYGTRYLLAPVLDLGDEKVAHFEAAFATALERGGVPVLEPGEGHAAHELLRFLVERKGLLARGTNAPGVDVFEPQEAVDYFGNPVKAVFAAEDGLWPMFFAIINGENPGLRVLWNACKWGRSDAGDVQRLYAFALNREALAGTPFVPGSVYLLPDDGFRRIAGADGLPTAERVCEAPVRPLAQVPVSPGDFPFLDEVQTFDLNALRAMREVPQGASAYAEHADGYTLAFDLRRTPMERIRLMVQFGQEFYPGWQAETAERSASEVWVRFRFPTGAIAFAKAELREILPPLDSLRRL